VLESVVRRTAYLAMLVEHPVILSQLARLAGMSPWISDQVARHPLLLDELLDPRRLFAPLRRADLEEELDVLLAPVDEEDLEQQMERLRQFGQGNMLRVAAADLTGAIPLMVVSDYLTEIAEVTVDRVLRLVFDHFVRRHGRPGGIVGEGTGFLVLGYGKLGGVELGYGSDLDLVFLHGTDDPSSVTTGERAISDLQFFMRLGQRIIHMMTTHTPSGQLYEVDMRLRPDGNKGQLVRSLASFAEYQAKDAWTWEHQALLRARPVAGSPTVARDFERIRAQTLMSRIRLAALRDDVVAMRARMRKELDRSAGGRFDLKNGLGGIGDIEFIVQYLVLRHAGRYPAVIRYSDNIRQLAALASVGLLDVQTAARLQGAYREFRWRLHHLPLNDHPPIVADTELAGERAFVAAVWARHLGAQRS